MAVAAKLLALAPDHHRNLGVGLPVDEAIDDLHPGAFERIGPQDILFFVETGFQFHHGGYGLARLRRVDQRADDRRLLARAIERLLDRHHIGIDRRLFEEGDDDVERLIGMVDDNVLGPDRGEAITAIFADAFGEARRIGLEFEVGPVLVNDAGQVADADKSLDLGDDRLMPLDHVLQHFLDRFGDTLFDFHADHAATAAALDRAAEVADQILGLFLDFDVAVADDAEHAAVAHLIAGEEIARKAPHHRFQRDIAGRWPRHAHEAVKRRGDHHQFADRLLVRQALQIEDDRQPLIGDEGEGMRRIKRLGRQDREDLGEEMIAQPGFAQGVHGAGRADDFDADLPQFAVQYAPDLLLRRHQPRGFGGDRGELLPGGQPVDRAQVDILQLLPLQPRDTDGEEFVQVRAGDGQEAQPFQQGMGAVHRFFQHPLVEGEPGEFAVEIAFAVQRQAGCGIGFGHGLLAVGGGRIGRHYRQKSGSLQSLFRQCGGNLTTR